MVESTINQLAILRKEGVENAPVDTTYSELGSLTAEDIDSEFGDVQGLGLIKNRLRSKKGRITDDNIRQAKHNINTSYISTGLQQAGVVSLVLEVEKEGGSEGTTYKKIDYAVNIGSLDKDRATYLLQVDNLRQKKIKELDDLYAEYKKNRKSN